MTVPARRDEDQAVLETLRALEEAGAVIDNGLFLPPDLPFDQYEALGSMLGVLHQMNAFLIGDWLLYGEHTYGEKYAQAAEKVGLSPQTLANYASISKRIPPMRRRLGVSHSKHAEVAALPPADQRRWLKVAEDENLTKEELRMRLREAGQLPPARPRTIFCPHCGLEIEL